MTDLSSKTICICDRGLFTTWALKMTEYFGRVLYWCDYKNAFPTSKQYMIGEGLDGVERVHHLFDMVDEVDVFAFPDVYDGDLQVHLREMGKPVWGSGKGEELELHRWETKGLLEEIGLPVQNVERIIGIDNLREYLMENDNKYVKVSMLRGDFETFHHETYDLTEPRLDEIDTRLGANKHSKEFIVEDAIDDASEIGYDGYTIDGNFPRLGIQGYEIKDVSYIGAIRPYSSLPKQVRIVNEKLSPVFANYQYRGFWSSEIRVPKDGKPYLTDPCCRAGSPPSELYQEMYSNWGEIIWGGAHGELVEPKSVAKFGIEVLIHSQWADQHWQAVYFPSELRKWVKLRNLCQIGDIWHVAPQTVGLPEIGAVVAVDDTILGCIRKVREYCDQVKGYSIDTNVGRIPDAIQAIRDGEKKGLHFSDDPLPSQAQIAAVMSSEIRAPTRKAPKPQPRNAPHQSPLDALLGMGT